MANSEKSLLQGSYDEKEAAADFQRALNEWRAGKKNDIAPVSGK